MTWTYDSSQLASSELMQVRMEIGDTDPDAQLLMDEEINHAISVERNIWGAAARCCEIVSRSFLRKADIRVGRGGTTVTYSTAAKQYEDMAKELRKRAVGTAAPWAGGVDVSDESTLSADPSKVQPIFTKTMQDNPRVGGQGSDSVTDDGQSSG